MALAEEVRDEFSAIYYLRNMSILRQAVLDLRSYFKRELSLGKKPDFDIGDWNGVTGDTCNFLR